MTPVDLLEVLAVLFLWRLQFRQLLEDLDFRLSLRCSVGVVPPSVNVGLEQYLISVRSCVLTCERTHLQMLPVHKLSLVLLPEVLLSIALGRVELGKVTLVVVETLAVLMDDIGRDGIEECSVV